MTTLTNTELVYLQAVERRGVHGLTFAEREAAMESTRAQGLVQNNLKTDAGFQITTITEAGRRALLAAKD
jgi:hypothetical protein